MTRSSLLFLLALSGLLMAAPRGSHAQAGITFTIDNVQLTTTGDGTVYEFDVMVAASATGTKLGPTLALITYNTAGFGENVATNGAITVTEGAFTSGNNNYGVVVNDNGPATVAITGTYNFLDPNNGEPLPTTPQQLFQVALDVTDPTATAGIGFDAVNMQGQQFEDDLDTTYEPVMANDTDDTLLPVELTAFEAVVDGEGVQLRWETASETNNAGFEVQQRRAEGPPNADAWRVLDFVDGQGTTAEPHVYTFHADALDPGTHHFRLKQVDFDGAFTYSPEVEATVEAPRVLRLAPNFPNPFNPSTEIRFTVPSDGRAEVMVYDVLGQHVATLFQGPAQAGRRYQVTFEADGLASGLYLYVLRHREQERTGRMLLLK
ncbi:MAG: T9SS type A sorting domain-containing protein [Bacteroidetes bacterium]|jgi:hypothetical protein|nr:T9SS type A sorting domain-containing protein [Bacteroidota bacterium]